MKVKEVRELSESEFQQRLEETQKELFNLRVQQSTGQLEKPSRIREVRREIARMKTVQGERNAESR